MRKSPRLSRLKSQASWAGDHCIVITAEVVEEGSNCTMQVSRWRSASRLKRGNTISEGAKCSDDRRMKPGRRNPIEGLRMPQGFRHSANHMPKLCVQTMPSSPILLVPSSANGADRFAI